ncbi:hypothetical protein [Pseudonocardia sp. GCM10023141]|uniref:hypothetical protein n=1 Tax=Pseudonocardia sp. GCM10023141 TaxID=3252653 RepID=UPI0036212123
MKTLILATVALGLAAAATLGLAGTAGASEPSGVITHPTTSYSSPSNVSAPVTSLPTGTQVQAVCFTEGQSVNGNQNWFRIIDGNGSSYVHRSAITVDPGLRHC